MTVQVTTMWNEKIRLTLIISDSFCSNICDSLNFLSTFSNFHDFLVFFFTCGSAKNVRWSVLTSAKQATVVGVGGTFREPNNLPRDLNGHDDTRNKQR
jgi:hypothetical protein